ncbi:alpha/beta fold hydrolase [Flocculibacter collagenilyticus]|uniref:alpha/beta fold hydrolase n=1 Tax=Flocculibacter collagenilyticus TaxID=2744479 RepID=UPI0018F2D93F|nr:alpha/beta fold hydrolase [Flocculibacter collagenilyticus]
MVLNYKLTGTGEPVVLMHGLFGSLENLSTIQRHLEKQYQVINIDLTNHGSSPHSDEFTYQSMANDVMDTMNHIGIDTFNLLGHSMGGKVAMTLALSAPSSVKKLICADIAPVVYNDRHTYIINALKSVDLANLASRNDADKQLSTSINELGVRQFLLKSLVKDEATQQFRWRFNLAGLAQNYSHIIGFDESDAYEYRHFDAPVLFIKGQNSDYITAEHRDVITSLFPNSQAKIISNAGHWLHAEKPVAFNQIVERFLQS